VVEMGDSHNFILWGAVFSLPRLRGNGEEARAGSLG
jgi:hypothetical protein